MTHAAPSRENRHGTIEEYRQRQGLSNSRLKQPRGPSGLPRPESGAVPKSGAVPLSGAVPVSGGEPECGGVDNGEGVAYL